MKITTIRYSEDFIAGFQPGIRKTNPTGPLRIALRFAILVANLRCDLTCIESAGNGTIEFDEFLQMMAKRAGIKDEANKSLAEAFEVFDKNRDGFITAQEIRIVLASLGETLSDKEVDDMIKMADTNGDGKISFDEFQNVWNMFGR